MNINELLQTWGIKTTSKIKKHPKMLQVLKYCNENNMDIYEHNISIKEEDFIILLENIHSINTLLKILKKIDILLNIDEDSKKIATFYNIYDPEKLQYNTYNEILLDSEYLKYATKEWTENILLAQTKVLHISNNGRLMLKPNAHKPCEEQYLESFLLNVVELKKAKELHLLKEAIEKLSNI